MFFSDREVSGATRWTRPCRRGIRIDALQIAVLFILLLVPVAVGKPAAKSAGIRGSFRESGTVGMNVVEGWRQVARSNANATTDSDSGHDDSGEIGDPASPEQLHLALAAARPRESYAMSISWVTWAAAKSHVVWGLSEDKLDAVVTGNSTSYTIHHLDQNFSAYTTGRLHSATIEGLEPNRTFFYACGELNSSLSTVRAFTTPGAVHPQQPVTFGILGDLGQTNDSRDTINSILARESPVNVVLHAGDLSYADCDEWRWDSFLNLLEPVASRIPWMVAAGNHEIEASNVEGEVFAAYEHRFRMPSVEPATRGLECGLGGGLDGNQTACGPGLNDMQTLEAAREADSAGLDGEGIADAVLSAREAVTPFGGVVSQTGWPVTEDGGADNTGFTTKCTPSEWSGTYDFGNSFYSFEVSSVHVVVLNPYTATGEGSKQHLWLQEDLEAVDRTLTPWVLAMFHCPWYNSNWSHQMERQALTAMRTMEPLLYQHKTAVIISGHVHAYERSLPVLSGTPTEGAPVNLVVGGSGNRENHDLQYYLLPEWSAFRNGSAYGAGTLSIHNSSMASWEWKSNDPDPVVHDSAWIVNPFQLS